MAAVSFEMQLSFRVPHGGLLPYRGGGPNGPTFRNIRYGSHMKKKNVVIGMYANLVYTFLMHSSKLRHNILNDFTKLSMFRK